MKKLEGGFVMNNRVKKFIRTELVQAIKMNKYEYYTNYKQVDCFEDNEPGYMIGEGQDSIWYNEDEFKKHHLQVDDNLQLPSGVSIGKEMVDNFIQSYEVIERDGKTTIVHATLINGFKLTEASSCVDPTNYSVEIGTEICLDKIKDSIWNLLGFLLQSAYNGFNKLEEEKEI